MTEDVNELVPVGCPCGWSTGADGGDSVIENGEAITRLAEHVLEAHRDKAMRVLRRALWLQLASQPGANVVNVPGVPARKVN